MKMESKTYIISSDEYMGVEPAMEMFKGTFFDLLVKLIGYEDEDEPWTLDSALLEFEDNNGDGQPYFMVWCVEDEKKVL
jgi:hypothetical protein